MGVGYVSAIATALTAAGDSIASQEDNDVTIKLWFAGGFLNCLFWVRQVTSSYYTSW